MGSFKQQIREFFNKQQDMGAAARDLAINLLTHAERSGQRAYLVTGVSSGCGTTFVSIELARAMAAFGKRVLLAEASPGRSVLAQRLGLARGNGVSEYLLGKPLDGLIEERGKNLFILTDGRRDDQLFSIKETEELYGKSKGEFDIVLMDSVNVSSPAFHIPSSMDGVILVVNGESDGHEALASSIKEVEDTGARVAGLILNRQRQFIPDCLMQVLGLR